MREEKGNSIIAFPSDYTIIDIETTGLYATFDSILEVSAIRVRNNSIVDEFSSLVKEHDGVIVDDFISCLTGISQQMIDHAPNTKDILKKYLAFLGNDVLVGHNVSFDINFIYDASERFYNYPLKNDFVDIMRIDRRLFKEEKHHRLSDISERLNIDYSGAHRSLVDCRITKLAYDKLRSIIENTIGESEFISSFKGSHLHRYSQYEHLNPDEIEPNIDSPLYGKTCVITGALSRFTRNEAFRVIERVGGFVGGNVTKNTNFLILGNNDYCTTIKDGKSTKQKKAEEYRLNGADIEIIPEAVFYELLGVEN